MDDHDCPACGSYVPPYCATLWWGRSWHPRCADGLDPATAHKLATRDDDDN
jgi:hypothetical protein